MREAYDVGAEVLVFDVPYNRARAELGAGNEPGIVAQPATIEAEITPRPPVWDPRAFDPATGERGRYVEGPPDATKVYQVRFADGSTASADVHRLLLPSESAATIEPSRK